MQCQKKLTLGRVAKNESGISISKRTPVFIATAALWIWFAQSRFCCKFFRAFSDRPVSGGTQGTGSHHFSSFRWLSRRKDDDPELNDFFPSSMYQNSGLWKLSKMSWYMFLVHKHTWVIYKKWLIITLPRFSCTCAKFRNPICLKDVKSTLYCLSVSVCYWAEMRWMFSVIFNFLKGIKESRKNEIFFII